MYSAFHIAQIQVGLAQPVKLGQARIVKVSGIQLFKRYLFFRKIFLFVKKKSFIDTVFVLKHVLSVVNMKHTFKIYYIYSIEMYPGFFCFIHVFLIV